MIHRLIIILLFFSSITTLAQDDDYYAPDAGTKKTVREVDDINRWGPKLGIEIHAAINYNHLVVPLALIESFQNAFGGVGFDGGGGIRIRAYHKLSFSIGANYATRSFHLEYQAEDINSGNTLQVTEKATMKYFGFYFKGNIALSKKFHIAQTFQYCWLRDYTGTAIAEDLSTGVIYGPQETSEPILDGWWAAGQAELGFEFAYMIHFAPELIIKPYGALTFGVTPALHTKIYSQGFFGEKEQNLSYLNIRLGVIIETGIILDQFKER